ncbi:MAG TPA: tRNA glutamyl-Q(34) synthetase GluQRS, partial [Planctomycetota bacterium]|nr:tRNA glutamyl-Q(34) synthetase GluQRS [Planctomycetota bacterium]
HVPLVVGPDGKRTAKRHGEARIADFRARGVRPERIIGVLARWSGLDVNGDVMPQELITKWSWPRVSRERVVLTDERLEELR